LAARPRPRPSTKSEKESLLTRLRHTTACCLCVPGWEGAACAPPEVGRKRPKEVERRTRARGQHDRSHPPKPTRGDNATGPPNRCLAWQATACRSPRTAHAGRRASADPRLRGERACRGTLWPARATKRRHPPDPRSETGRGPQMRCLGRRGAPAQAPPIPQCLLIGPRSMRGLTAGQWLPSALSAHATQAVDIRVCEALIAITRRDNGTTHFCATLSNLPPSVVTGRHIVRLRQVASNHVHRRTEGAAQHDQIAARSRQNILKIPGLHECHFEAGARLRNFALTANQRAPLPSADRRA